MESDQNNLLKNLSERVTEGYKDEDAVRKGILIALKDGDRNTGHRVTDRAFRKVIQQYNWDRFYFFETNKEYEDLILEKIQPLVPVAETLWRDGRILALDYKFNVQTQPPYRKFWLVPNEVGGVTLMRPRGSGGESCAHKY